MTVRWTYFPQSTKAPAFVPKVVSVFEASTGQIESSKRALSSNDVLAVLRPGLMKLGFEVERGKKADEQIEVPVLYGENGVPRKSFRADAHHREWRVVLEVEAGRGFVNNQFLKDLFQACMMDDVDYLILALRQIYQGGDRGTEDYRQVVTFFETLYASRRLTLPLKGLAVIGY